MVLSEENKQQLRERRESRYERRVQMMTRFEARQRAKQEVERKVNLVGESLAEAKQSLRAKELVLEEQIIEKQVELNELKNERQVIEEAVLLVSKITQEADPYEAAVAELEAEGLTRSDAQAVVDAG